MMLNEKSRPMISSALVLAAALGLKCAILEENCPAITRVQQSRSGAAIVENASNKSQRC
jgi:hypothetical protein